MNRLLQIAFIALILFWFSYLLLPTPGFPPAPPNSLISTEPGDIKNPAIRAYFTNLSREQVISHLYGNFSRSSFLNLPFYVLRLPNHPPEDASTVIGEQTKSSYLEELVHPFRESVFVNGWEPKEAKDAINVSGQNFKNKITIKYVTSSPLARLIVGITVPILVWISISFFYKLKN